MNFKAVIVGDYSSHIGEMTRQQIKTELVQRAARSARNDTPKIAVDRDAIAPPRKCLLCGRFEIACIRQPCGH